MLQSSCEVALQHASKNNYFLHNLYMFEFDYSTFFKMFLLFYIFHSFVIKSFEGECNVNTSSLVCDILRVLQNEDNVNKLVKSTNVKKEFEYNIAPKRYYETKTIKKLNLTCTINEIA